MHLTQLRAKFWAKNDLKLGNQNFADEPKSVQKLLHTLWTNSNFLGSRRIEHCSVINYVNILLTWGCNTTWAHSLGADSTMRVKTKKYLKLWTLTDTLSGNVFHVQYGRNHQLWPGWWPAEIKQDHRDTSITTIINQTLKVIMIILIDIVLT